MAQDWRQIESLMALDLIIIPAVTALVLCPLCFNDSFASQNSGSCSGGSPTGSSAPGPILWRPWGPWGHPPSLLTVQDHQSCMGHGSAGWAPWHTACPTHLLCMADTRRGEETDDLWFGVTLISSGKGAEEPKRDENQRWNGVSNRKKRSLSFGGEFRYVPRVQFTPWPGTNSVTSNNLDWFDTGCWSCQIKTCWCCRWYCSWLGIPIKWLDDLTADS